MGWIKERLKKVVKGVGDVAASGIDFFGTLGQSTRDIVRGDVSAGLKRLYYEGLQTDLEGLGADWFSTFVGAVDPAAADKLHDFIDEHGVEVTAAAASIYFGGPAVFAAAGGGAVGTLAVTGTGLTALGGVMKYKESKEREKREGEYLDRLGETATENARREVQNLMTEVQDREDEQVSQIHATQLFSGGIKEGTGTSDFLKINRERARKMAEGILKEGQREAQETQERKKDMKESERWRRATDLVGTATDIGRAFIPRGTNAD